MAKVDLSGLSLEELNTLIDEAGKLRDKLVEEKRADLLKQLQALDGMASKKVSARRQRSASNYTHRHPKTGHEWLGRGGVPKEWRDIITDGMTKEQRADELAKYRVEK